MSGRRLNIPQSETKDFITKQQAGWVSYSHGSPCSLSPMEATQSNLGGCCTCCGFVSQLRNPELGKIGFFHSGLQANLPKLCTRGKHCLNILDDNQICPPLKKHTFQGCFLYKCLLKDCSEQQAISASAHKICRNARDSGRTGSPKWEISKNKERNSNVYTGEN